MIELVLAVANMTPGRSRGPSVRVRNMHTTSAYIDASAAASVAVNSPLRTPNTVRSGITKTRRLARNVLAMKPQEYRSVRFS